MNARMNNLTLLKSICNTIKTYLNLDNKRIYIYNQKYIIPNDDGCYVCVGEQSDNIYANNNYLEKQIIIDGDKTKEIVVEKSFIHKQVTVSIIVYSYDFKSMIDKDKIIMSFKSIVGKQEQEKYDYKVAITGTYNTNNELDGDKMLYKYNILLNCLIMNKNEYKNIDFYNKSDFNIIENK